MLDAKRSSLASALALASPLCGA